MSQTYRVNSGSDSSGRRARDRRGDSGGLGRRGRSTGDGQGGSGSDRADEVDAGCHGRSAEGSRGRDGGGRRAIASASAGEPVEVPAGAGRIGRDGHGGLSPVYGLRDSSALLHRPCRSHGHSDGVDLGGGRLICMAIAVVVVTTFISGSSRAGRQSSSAGRGGLSRHGDTGRRRDGGLDHSRAVSAAASGYHGLTGVSGASRRGACLRCGQDTTAQEQERNEREGLVHGEKND
ncbi:uncharacterized protein PG986_000195 [Apiospora aurea]|uniref:Uncharacterized protein n=1 Tax=Apiospora aurea TaxID=335848 RepID=A0ABR1QTE4_9PEZI